jgi:polysaccharide deacetylase family protein (PEP-CTERM system associated)
MYFLLTVDVEDWFQVENLKPYIPFDTWDQRELRVEKNVHRLLNLFDSIKLNTKRKEINKPKQLIQQNQQINNSQTYLYDNKQLATQNSQLTTNYLQTKKVKATFFILGWIAKRIPHLVSEIYIRGHEVASHGYYHRLCNQQSRSELKKDLTDSKKKLEDIIGAEIYGFRYPSFVVNDDALKIIGDSGYHYDSSYNSFRLHGRYGKISLNDSSKQGIAHKLSDNFYELPISNLELCNTINYWLSVMHLGRNTKARFVLPFGGGAYFRLIPYRLFKTGVKSIIKKDGAYVFYLHPWEVDPHQPRVHSASFNHRFRHYINLGKTYQSLKDLITSFDNYLFVPCKTYLEVTS